MNLLKNAIVRVKLVIAFAIVALLIDAVDWVRINSIKNVSENTKKLFNVLSIVKYITIYILKL
ncbi:hypothetical protein [uncultured Clostridium sp.]|uniref:hypothetical protein n=1 Tax=uncultured Clostridium sp. TaxID=59620 RepID=UPI0028E4C3E3|nr:hypothetical protein [uncultured Clostridium sp.]